MITSIFSKSKPFNIVLTIILVVFVFGLYNYLENVFKDTSTFQILIVPLIITYYVLITDFIIAKNDLTKRHSYGIMAFGFLILVFTEVFSNINVLIANLLILFALRRLLSLHTERAVLKKCFDAAFWIGLATLFYSWSILFTLVLIAALLYYGHNQKKTILASLLGFLTVFIFLIIYNIVLNDDYILASNFSFGLSLNFSSYNTPSNIIRFAVIGVIYIWSSIYYFKNISEKNSKIKPAHVLIVIASFSAITIAIIASLKNGSEFIFLLFPLSVIIANYLQAVENIWIREIIALLLLALPVLNLVL